MTTFRANGLNRNKVFSYTVEPSSLWTVPVLLALEIACPSVLDCGAPTIWKKILQKIVATVCSLWTSQKVTTCFLIAGSIFKDLICAKVHFINPVYNQWANDWVMHDPLQQKESKEFPDSNEHSKSWICSELFEAHFC